MSMFSVHLCNPVSMEDFGNYVLEMSQDAGRKFSLEYEVLRPIGAAYPHEVAERPANCGKNRYTNILPYDFSRVKLSTVDGVEGSDYINASYIPGLHTAREYIAAQGPLPNTCADFWRMVWEQETQIIVMLTQCVERGRIKCEHYWPFDEEPVFYESTAVSMSAEEQHGDWTLRDLQLQKGTTKRSVLHFHYTAWPDHDVPSESCTRGVLEFVRCVRGKADIHAGPMVVQCSAGVGRTGSFITLDRLLQHLESHHTVDILGLVAQLRTHRPSMVQTEAQYVFIYLCLLELWSKCGAESDVHSTVYANVLARSFSLSSDQLC
uniref:protein-tyrosine-phosphatase n=1 Tax=Eptatretus burgeri TaxID=7764 RepID=A0A8C4QLC0_EPTBU